MGQSDKLGSMMEGDNYNLAELDNNRTSIMVQSCYNISLHHFRISMLHFRQCTRQKTIRIRSWHFEN